MPVLTGARTLLVALAALAASVFPTYAETVVRTVGQTNVNFVVPEGQCLASESNPQDAKFINIVGTLLKNANNRLILLTVECKRLQSFRAGQNGPILDYVTYYTPVASESAVLQGNRDTNRKALCNDLRQTTDKALDDVKNIVDKTAKELKANMGVNSTQYMGVLAEDDHGCYAGLLVGVKGATGNLIMSTVILATTLNDKTIFSAYYDQFTEPAVTERDIARAKATALDQINP